MNLKLPFDLPDGHEVEVIAVGCFDWRFRKQFMTFFETYLRYADFFPLNFPGGAKLINEQPDIIIPAFFSTAIEKCGTSQIMILDHEDCLAWGGSSAFENSKLEREFHFEQLVNARNNLKKAYPEKNLRADLYYAQFMKDKFGRHLLDFIKVKN